MPDVWDLCSPQHNKSYKDVTIVNIIIIIIVLITNEEIGNTCIEWIECVVGNIESSYQISNITEWKILRKQLFCGLYFVRLASRFMI